MRRPFATCPGAVEKGPVFPAKHLAKSAATSLSDDECRSYTAAEVFNATIGRVDRVERDGHKGFDYAWLAERIARRFTIIRYEGFPLSW